MVSGQVSRASEHSGEHGIVRQTDRKRKQKKYKVALIEGSASIARGAGLGFLKGWRYRARARARGRGIREASLSVLDIDAHCTTYNSAFRFVASFDGPFFPFLS